MNVVLFGTGCDFIRYIRRFDEDAMASIIAIADNDSSKWEMAINGIKVISPQNISDLSFDKIYIATNNNYIRISKQLVSIGIDENKIIPPFKICDELGKHYRNIKPMYFTNGHDEVQPGIYLFSNDANLTGAPIALLNMAIALSDRGYHVVVVIPEDGAIRGELLKEHIDTIIDENINNVSIGHLEYLDKIGVAIVNTAVMAGLLTGLRPKIKVLWWIHEASEVYSLQVIDKIKYVNLDNVCIRCVSDIAKRNFLKNINAVVDDNLPFCVADHGIKTDENNTSKIRFRMIGAYSPNKRQKSFVMAVNQLPVSVFEKAEFSILGDESYNPQYALECKKEDKLSRVSYLAPLGRSQIYDIYDNTDVLVSCSCEEMLSTVCIEAMSKGITCIMVNTNGASSYVRDKDSALVIESFSINTLCHAIEWCVNNRDSLTKIGQNARSIYENYFTDKKFIKNLKGTGLL